MATTWNVDVNLLCWKEEITQHAKDTIFIYLDIVNYAKPCLSVCHSDHAEVFLSPSVHATVSVCCFSYFLIYKIRTLNLCMTSKCLLLLSF